MVLKGTSIRMFTEDAHFSFLHVTYYDNFRSFNLLSVNSCWHGIKPKPKLYVKGSYPTLILCLF